MATLAKPGQDPASGDDGGAVLRALELVGGGDVENGAPTPLCADIDGFSLHAAVLLYQPASAVG